ncbi:MAG: proline dehydrogenase family protein [Vampirovibrionales bacterium]|nr:proline dehydrogenase family protein [Vampirovibrionales bacterium]
MSLINTALAYALPYAPKSLVWPFAKPYVAGETVQDALKTVQHLNQQQSLATIDYLGEFISTAAEAEAALAEYQWLLEDIALKGVRANISIKLSQLGLKQSPEACYQRLITLLAHAHEPRALIQGTQGTPEAQPAANFIRIDMEDASCTDETLAIYRAARKHYNNLGIVLQSRLRRTADDAQALLDEGIANIRLCKGVYLEPRTRAYSDPALIRENTIAILEMLLKATPNSYVGIASHDETILWHARRLIAQYQLQPHQVEFQMLLGVEPLLQQLIVQAGHKLRIYVPYGKHWHAYCMRRMRENPNLAGYVAKNWFQQFTR